MSDKLDEIDVAELESDIKEAISHMSKTET